MRHSASWHTASVFCIRNAHSRSLRQPTSTQSPSWQASSSAHSSSCKHGAEQTPSRHFAPTPGHCESFAHWRHVPSTHTGVCSEVHSAFALHPGGAVTHRSSSQACEHWHKLRYVLQNTGSISQLSL